MIGALSRAPRAAWLWLAAGWAALAVLRRLWRGEVVLLSAHAAPVVRLVAIVLVFAASCVEKLRPAPPSSQGGTQDLSQGTAAPEAVVASPPDFPDTLDAAAIERRYRWIEPRRLHVYFEGEAADAPRSVEPVPAPGDLALADAVGRLLLMIGLHVARAWANEPPLADAMIDLLDGAESLHLFDEWLAGHLWRHARTLSPAPVVLLGRLERHLRVVHAQALAEAETGPIEITAWRSKAGPPPGWTGRVVPAGLAAAARAAFLRGADAGTWASESVLPLRVSAGAATLVRGGQEVALAVGTTLTLRRLDVVRTGAGARLVHATLGELTLPAGGELTAWSAASRLGEAAREALRARVEAALAGDAAALAELEAVVVAAHPAIRAAVERRPDGPGAPGLRMLLVAFDE